MRQQRRPYRGPDDTGDDAANELASVHDRLDALTRQLESMAHGDAQGQPVGRAPVQPPRAPNPPQPERADLVSDALVRLDRRLDQVISESRATASEFKKRSRQASRPIAQPAMAAPYQPAPAAVPQYAPAPAPAPSRDPSHWASQIAARQRALDHAPTAAPVAPVAAPAVTAPAWGGQELAQLQQQLHQINEQIASLHQPQDGGIDELRAELAEIGRTLADATPRRAIEGLEQEFRALAARVDHSRQNGTDGAALGALERELAEMRSALHGLKPVDNLAGFEDALRGLYHKLDEMAATLVTAPASAAGPGPDPTALRQLEQAVTSLRGAVSNVATDGALAQLAAEVRGLGAQFDRAPQSGNEEALHRLESRIAALAENSRGIPPELEQTLHALGERIDRMQLSQGDQLALVALEDRITQLAVKLDASDARLGHLGALERGLADLLVYLEEMRARPVQLQPAPQPMAAPAPEPQPQPQAPPIAHIMPAPQPMLPPAVPHHPTVATADASPLDLIHDEPIALAPPPAPPAPPPVMQAPQPYIEAPMAPPPMAQAPQPAPPRPQPKQMPRGPQRQPIDPHLPADTPLEPGSGAPRVKPGSAAARIAASEAALGGQRQALAEGTGKSAAIAAARNAAKAAALDMPAEAKPAGPSLLSRLKWPSKKVSVKLAEPVMDIAPARTLPPAPTLAETAPLPEPIERSFVVDDDAPKASRGRQAMAILKNLLIAASVAIIVVGVVQTALEFLSNDSAISSDSAPAKDQSQQQSDESGLQQPRSVPGRQMPGPSTLPAVEEPATTQSLGRTSSFFDPNTAIKMPDVTGSISRKPATGRTPSPAAPVTPAPEAEWLPPSISQPLRTAAVANDAAAQYELGTRFAEGRGVTQNMAEAAVWLQRAADAGFTPAQFRLASLNEKGEAGRRDVQAARRLYLTAAMKGHAKAMHNLAVLYAEGVDGKPDYQKASEWFRKAASYGVADSQYNLAILYARGIGVAVNLAESYRWFALAAARGDNEAAKKRDEVAGRLDQKTVTSINQAVQSFAPEREPEDAVSVKAPPGGWDHTPAAPAKATKRNPA